MRATHHSIEGPTGTFDYVSLFCTVPAASSCLSSRSPCHYSCYHIALAPPTAT